MPLRTLSGVWIAAISSGLIACQSTLRSAIPSMQPLAGSSRTMERVVKILPNSLPPTSSSSLRPSTLPGRIADRPQEEVGHAQATELPCNGDLGGSGCDDARLG